MPSSCCQKACFCVGTLSLVAFSQVWLRLHAGRENWQDMKGASILGYSDLSSSQVPIEQCGIC